MVEKPWCAMLFYGKVYFFADQLEFNQCCREYFLRYGDSECPVCGEPLGGHFKYSFLDVMRIPQQLYFCSYECLRTFNNHMMFYLGKLTKPYTDYFTGIT